jgi:hypothetical protein
MRNVDKIMTELLRYRDLTRVIYFRDLLEQAGIRTFIRNENLSNTGVSIPDYFPALCILNESEQQVAVDLIRGDLAASRKPCGPEWICTDCQESSPANFDTCWNCGAIGLSPSIPAAELGPRQP